MPKIFPIQQNFSAGEISPLLRGQVRSDVYQRALDSCVNFLPRPQGSLQKRGGLVQVADFGEVNDPQTDDYALFGLDINEDQTFVVAINGTWVQVFDDFGAVFQGYPGLNWAVNPLFRAGLKGWTVERYGGPAAVGPRGDVSFQPDQDAVFIESPESTFQGTVGALFGQRFRIAQGAVPDATNNFRFRVDNFPVPGFELGTMSIRVGGALDDGTYLNMPIPPEIGVEHALELPQGGGVGLDIWITVRLSTPANTARTGRLIDAVRFRKEGPVTLARFTSLYSSVVRQEIAAEQHPTAAQLLFAHPFAAPQQISVDATNTWSYGNISFTNAPSDWSADNGYPGALAATQGRLWFGGSPAFPSRVWASEVDDYFTFTTGTNPENPITFTLAERGQIRWMSGSKDLVLGTDNAEYLVVGPVAGFPSNGDIAVQKQSRYGSISPAHIDLGYEIMYASGGERKVRLMGYERDDDAWTSIDIAWPSEHLTETRIDDMVYVRDPFQLVWMNTRAYGLIVCAFDREQNIIGWARCPVGFGGEVLALATTTNSGVGQLYAIVRYSRPDSSGVLFESVQRLDRRVAMDNQTTLVFENPTTTLTGLDRYRFFTIKILVDGAVHPDVTVPANAEIELQFPGRVIQIGLGFQALARTLPLEGGNQAGTSQGLTKRYNRAWGRLYQSAPLQINGQLPPDRNPATPMGQPEPPTSDDVEVRLLGWDDKAQLEYTQDDPLLTTLVALFGEASVSVIGD